MYSETEKYTPKSDFAQILQLLGYIAAVIVMARAAYALRDAYGLPWVEFAPYLGAAYLAVRIYRRNVVEYNYKLSDTLLVLEKAAGKRVTPVARVPFASITDYGPYDPRQKPPKIAMCALPASRNKTLLRYLADGDKDEKAVVFSPSAELDGRIRLVISGQGRGSADESGAAPSDGG